jgi:hypothetical protein
MTATMIDVVTYVRVYERLRGISVLLATAHRELREIHELDNDLAPELLAMSTAMLETLKATSRALKFMDARLDAKEVSDE